MSTGLNSSVANQIRREDRDFADPDRVGGSVALESDLGETDLVNAAVTLELPQVRVADLNGHRGEAPTRKANVRARPSP